MSSTFQTKHNATSFKGFRGGEEPLEEGMATHSSGLVWEIPPSEEPGGLQSRGSKRVGHD